MQMARRRTPLEDRIAEALLRKMIERRIIVRHDIAVSSANGKEDESCREDETNGPGSPGHTSSKVASGGYGSLTRSRMEEQAEALIDTFLLRRRRTSGRE